MSDRRVIAHCTISLDGYSSGPGGPEHDDWLHEHALRPKTAEYFEGIWRGCDAAMLGRTNYLGFHSVWPGIAEDPDTDVRTRDLAHWLCSVEKAVVSTTLPQAEATWANSRVFRSPADAVDRLRAEPGRDILVLNSAQLIGTMLVDGLVDELRLVLVPVLLGGGLRLLPEGGESSWELVVSTTLPDGAVGVQYRKA
jgi:dihydrofolate reductase